LAEGPARTASSSQSTRPNKPAGRAASSTIQPRAGFVPVIIAISGSKMKTWPSRAVTWSRGISWTHPGAVRAPSCPAAISTANATPSRPAGS